jgi:hypothetical protein
MSKRNSPIANASARKAVADAVEGAKSVGRVIKNGAAKAVDVIRHGPASRALKQITRK